MNSDITLEHCRKLLKRIAWKIQYQVKKQQRNECPIILEVAGGDSTLNSLSSFFIDEILRNIPSQKGKQVIQLIILEGYTEKEVAFKLNMTQQGVNKCKKNTSTIYARKSNFFNASKFG